MLFCAANRGLGLLSPVCVGFWWRKAVGGLYRVYCCVNKSVGGLWHGSEIFPCMLQECLSSQYVREMLEGSCRKCLSLFITPFVTGMSVSVCQNVKVWGGFFRSALDPLPACKGRGRESVSSANGVGIFLAK